MKEAETARRIPRALCADNVCEFSAQDCFSHLGTGGHDVGDHGWAGHPFRLEDEGLHLLV